MRICEGLIVFFSYRFCKSPFWKLSPCSHPVLHLMISLARDCCVSRLCPFETETASVFVTYLSNPSEGHDFSWMFPTVACYPDVATEPWGKSHCRIWGHGCFQRDLQCSRPDHEPCIRWCLVEYPDGLTVGFVFFFDHFFCNFWGGCNSDEKWPSVHKTRGLWKCLWAVGPMMCEKDAAPLCNFRFDSPAQKKTASWPGSQGPYLWLTQDFVHCLNAFDLDFTTPTRWAPTSYKWSYGAPINGLANGESWGYNPHRWS